MREREKGRERNRERERWEGVITDVYKLLASVR